MTETLKRSRDLPLAGDEISEDAVKRAKIETDQLEHEMAADGKIKVDLEQLEGEMAAAGKIKLEIHQPDSDMAVAEKEDSLPNPPASDDKSGDLPVTIMYKTFVNGSDCRDYYTRLLHQLRVNQDLNEYEHNMVLGLLRKGHPDPPRKIGSGIKAIQVRDETFGTKFSRVFILVHTDGSDDDFSVKKCILKLFPKSTPLTAPIRAPGGGPRGGRLAGPRGAGRGGPVRGGPGRGAPLRGGAARGGPGRAGPGRGRARGPMRGGRGGPARGRGGRRGRF